MWPHICGFKCPRKILIRLKTLAPGSFQNTPKDALNVSPPTVSVVLDQFVKALNRRATQYIYMPRNAKEIEKTKENFTILVESRELLDVLMEHMFLSSHHLKMNMLLLIGKKFIPSKL